MEIPPLAREGCLGSQLPPPPTPGEEDYQVYGVRMVGAVEKCDDKRALGVAAMDLHNAYVDRLGERLRPKTFWEGVFGKRLPDIPKPSLGDVEVPVR